MSLQDNFLNLLSNIIIISNCLETGFSNTVMFKYNSIQDGVCKRLVVKQSSYKTQHHNLRKWKISFIENYRPITSNYISFTINLAEFSWRLTSSAIILGFI